MGMGWAMGMDGDGSSPLALQPHSGVEKLELSPVMAENYRQVSLYRAIAEEEEEQKDRTVQYAVEGTPLTFSRAESLSDLEELEVRVVMVMVVVMLMLMLSRLVRVMVLSCRRSLRTRRRRGWWRLRGRRGKRIRPRQPRRKPSHSEELMISELLRYIIFNIFIIL